MKMELQLIKGRFEIEDALNLITKLVETKIKYLESKINNQGFNSEEDIKRREKRIIELQNELKQVRDNFLLLSSGIELNASITINGV